MEKVVNKVLKSKQKKKSILIDEDIYTIFKREVKEKGLKVKTVVQKLMVLFIDQD